MMNRAHISIKGASPLMPAASVPDAAGKEALRPNALVTSTTAALPGRGASFLSVLKIICMYCHAAMGEKDGQGVSGTSHSICEKCWAKHYPEHPYPGKKERIWLRRLIALVALIALLAFFYWLGIQTNWETPWAPTLPEALGTDGPVYQLTQAEAAAYTASINNAGREVSLANERAQRSEITLFQAQQELTSLRENPIIQEVIQEVEVIKEIEKPVYTALKDFPDIPAAKEWLVANKVNEPARAGVTYFVNPPAYDCEDYALELQRRAAIDGWNIWPVAVTGGQVWNILVRSQDPNQYHVGNMMRIGSTFYYVESTPPNQGNITPLLNED